MPSKMLAIMMHLWCKTLQEVCACYWPRIDINLFRDMDVELIDGYAAKSYTIRIIKITNNKVRMWMRTCIWTGMVCPMQTCKARPWF